MNTKNNCNIVSVGKRRDGGTRYWCLQHKADATAKYGVPAPKCRYADIPIVSASETVKIDIAEYPGGVALWGAVPPVYDTTLQPLDRGIHVHARQSSESKKEIDETFRKVFLVDGNNPLRKAEISELDAIYYMVTSIFGYPMKYIECTRCHCPHLDKDWFSLNPHQRHLCAGCGQYFRDDSKAIGNPIKKTQSLFDNQLSKTKKINSPLKIKQSDYKGGVQICGSNSAIFWTSGVEEEEGIHVHAFTDDKSLPVIDDTFSKVVIDGFDLDPSMVRTLMAQNSIPHISGRVVSFSCPHCNNSHFSDGESSFTPSKNHICNYCHKNFQSKGRLKNVVGNPLIQILSDLKKMQSESLKNIILIYWRKLFKKVSVEFYMVDVA